MRRSLTMLIHGHPGAGKTPASLTAPAPRLVLDAEGGSNYAAHNAVDWRPWEHGSEPPAEAEGAEMVRVFIRDFATMRQAYAYLASNPGRFRSVTLDSITEIQKRCKDALGPNAFGGKSAMQDWGVILTQMEGLIRGMRDLVTTEHFDVLAITGISAEIQGMTRPSVQGALSIQLPGHVDVIGYLGTFRDSDNHKYRGMQIQGDDRIVAKDRTASLPGGGLTGKYGEIVPCPINIERMLDEIH